MNGAHELYSERRAAEMAGKCCARCEVKQAKRGNGCRAGVHARYRAPMPHLDFDARWPELACQSSAERATAMRHVADAILAVTRMSVQLAENIDTAYQRVYRKARAPSPTYRSA